MEFGEALRLICEQIKPQKILEFGSGESTTVFADFGHVTVIEYDPPGDWYGVGLRENVKFLFVEHEEEAYFPKNLLKTFYEHVLLDGKNETEDLLRQPNLMKGRMPKWDMAYIDGAVHVRGFSMKEEQPGWVGGDLSYITRMTLAGMCLSYARFVLIDDISFMPMLHNLNVQTIGNRFSLITRTQ